VRLRDIDHRCSVTREIGEGFPAIRFGEGVGEIGDLNYVNFLSRLLPGAFSGQKVLKSTAPGDWRLWLRPEAIGGAYSTSPPSWI